MGFLKSFLKGAKEPIYAKRAEENRQRIGLNYALYMENKLDISVCISNVSFMTAEQVKYIMFRDIENEELSLLGVVMAAHFLAFSHKILTNSNEIESDLKTYSLNHSYNILKDIFENNKLIRGSQIDLYRDLYFKTLDYYLKPPKVSSLGDEFDDITQDLYTYLRDYSDGGMDEYVYLSGLIKDIFKKFEIAIEHKETV